MSKMGEYASEVSRGRNLVCPDGPSLQFLRPEVLAFAHLMERQLRANSHKPGWKNDSPEALVNRIEDEFNELDMAIRNKAPAMVVAIETADVANFAMMVADVCGALHLSPANEIMVCRRGDDDEADQQPLIQPDSNAAGDGWQDISTAPKDGTTIWAAFHDDIFPRLRPTREDLEPWNGRQVPLRHPGIADGHDGKPFDMGWNIAAPVGNGGFPDEWIAGWRPLPALPAQPTASTHKGK